MKSISRILLSLLLLAGFTAGINATAAGKDMKTSFGTSST